MQYYAAIIALFEFWLFYTLEASAFVAKTFGNGMQSINEIFKIQSVILRQKLMYAGN